MYYPKYKVIFVAINKTGSTSILSALKNTLYEPNVEEFWQLNGNPGVAQKHKYLKHAQAYFYYHYLGEMEYSNCFSFSQVRNPWDKVVSDFFFRCQVPEEHELWKTNRKWFINNGLMEPTENPERGLFKLFVKALGKRELTPHVHWDNISRKFNLPDNFKTNTNQLDGLTDLDGNIMVNKILKLEDAAQEWELIQAIIKDKTGMELGPLPHVNKSKREDYKYYYDEETYGIINEIFKKDIEYFNYCF